MALGPIRLEVEFGDKASAGIKHLSDNVGKLGTATKQATVATVEQAAGLKKLEAMWSATTFQLQKFARVAVSLQVIMGTITTVLGIKAIIDAADAWAQMSGRLRLVTGSATELAAVQSKLFALAQELRLPMEDVAKLYTRIAVNAEALGLSQTQVLSVTKAVSQAMQISGSTAEEAAAGVLQFTQAIASSNFQGDELRTLLESQPRLLRAIAEGLKVLSPEFKKLTDGGMASTAALRHMGKEGKLSADLLLAAISSQRHTLEQEFGELPRTVGQAWTQVTNVVNRALASVSTKPITDALDRVKQAFSDQAFLERFAKAAALSLELAGAGITGSVRAVEAMASVIEKGALSALIVAAGLAVAKIGGLSEAARIAAAGGDLLSKAYLSANGAMVVAANQAATLASVLKVIPVVLAFSLVFDIGGLRSQIEQLEESFVDMLFPPDKRQKLKNAIVDTIRQAFGAANVKTPLPLAEGLAEDQRRLAQLRTMDAIQRESEEIALKARKQTPDDIKKEVDAAVKLLESKLTLQREMLKLQEASGTIGREERLVLEIGYLERYDEQIGKLLPKLNGMPLEYNQLAVAQLKARQEVIDLTKALHEQEDRFVPAVSLTSRLVDQIRNRTTAEEMLAEQVKPLTQADEQHVLVLDDVRTAMGRVGNVAVTLSKEIEAIDERVQKGTATWRDYQKIVDEATKVELDRIDVMEKLHRMSPIDADRQRVAVLEQQRELWVKIREQIDPLDKQALKEFDVGLLQIDAKIKDLIDHSLSFGAAVQKAFDGITDILSLFGVKVGKFILMLQNMPKAISGLRGVFAGLGGLMTLTSSGLGLQGTAFAGVGEAVADLGNASGKTAGVLGFLSGTISVVIRTLMLFGNGLTGILGFFGQIVQGIASGGGIINTITSAFSGLVSSGGALYGVFNGLSNAGSALFSIFTEGTSLAGIFQGAFNALGLTSGGFAAGGQVAGGTLAQVGGAGQFASFLGQWVPIVGALYMAAMAIQNFFSGGTATKIGTGIGLVLAGPFGAYFGGIIGGMFEPTPKAKLSASIAPFDRNAIGSAIDPSVPGTQVGAAIVNVGGNIMKGKKERALQEVLATMMNEMLIRVVDATVLMIKTLPFAIGTQLDQALTDLEATGLEIVDKKWKGGKAGKKFNKRVKGLMEETLQDLVTALDFGDVDLKALGFDPNDPKGKKGGEVARGFEAMMMALGGLSAIIKEVGPAVDLSGISLAQFTKGAIDLFKGFAKEGEAFKDTITRIMQTFGEIIAVKEQIHAALATMSGDLTEVVALVTRQLEAIEVNMVSMADALTVAIESGGTPEEVLAAAKAATEAVIQGLQAQIEAVTSLHDAVLKLNSAITGGVDLIINLTQKINELRGIETSASDFQFGLDGIVSLFNTLTDVTSRIALFQAGLIGMTTNLSLFMANLPLVVEGFNIIMAQIREMANPTEAIAALKGLAGAVESGLQAAVAAVNRQTQERIAALMAERAAIVDSTAALRTQRTAMQEAFNAEKKGLEAQKALIRLPFTEQRSVLEALKRAEEARQAANRLVYEEQRAALETALSLSREWANVLQSVRSQLVDLFNLLAPTHPLTSLNDVQTQFDAAFAAFQAAPTAEGATGVQDLARQLLQLAQQTPGFDLPSANFQALAASVRTALTAIDTFASAQPTQEDIQAQIVALEELQTGTLDDINRQIQDLNDSEAAALAGIDAQIETLQASSDALLAGIDSQIAILDANQASALASIDARVAQANADGQASIQYLQELAAQGLEAIRNQLVIEVTALAAQQALAAAALQTVLGDKTYEQFIAEKQREAANLLRGIDETLQYYLGQILTKLFPGVTVSQPVSPARLQEAVSGLSTLARLAQGGNFTSLAQSLASASQAASVSNVGGVTSSLTAATQNMAGLSYFQSGPGAGFLSQLQEINSLTQQSQFVMAISRVTQLIESINAAGIYTQAPVPGYAEGTAFVPSTGMALLHRGERVLTSDENKMYSRWNGGGATTTNITFAPTIQITGTTNARKMADEIEDALVEKMQTGSRLRQATKALVGGRG